MGEEKGIGVLLQEPSLTREKSSGCCVRSCADGVEMSGQQSCREGTRWRRKRRSW